MAKLNFVSKNIKDQIYRDLSYLEASSQFDLIQKHRVFHNLRVEADKQSVAIELTNGNKAGKGRSKKIALENLEMAREALFPNCQRELEEPNVKVAAALVNNYQSGEIGYRNATARTVNHSTEPLVYPSPGRIPSEMYYFFEGNRSLEDPIEKAIHAHFHITRIHPFTDGNGRLARLAQNSLLDFARLPPIIINPFDRSEYMDLIQAAQKSYRENNGQMKPEQSTFFNYLALKLRDSLVETGKQVSSKK